MAQPSPGLPQSFVSVDSCGVCGHVFEEPADACVNCGTPVAYETFPTLAAGTLAERVSACGAGMATLCYTVDVLVVMACAGMSGLLWTVSEQAARGGWSVGGAAVGAGLGLAGGALAVLAAYRRWGRAIGGLAAGTRCVDALSYLPALPLLAGPLTGSRPVLVDVRGGVDPLTAALEPWDGLGSGTLPEDGHTAATRARRWGAPGAVMVVFDSGQVHRFVGSCVLGRGPDSGEGVDTLRLPDLSRRLAASHAQVFDTADEAGDAVFEVVDLGSLTGTWLDGGAGEARLAAGEKARVSAGCSVRIGDYRFHLERSE